MKKKLICFVLSLFICTSFVGAVNAEDIYNSAINYLISGTNNPQIGSIGGDWIVTLLSESGYKNDDFYSLYYNNVCNYVKENKSEYIGRIATDNARVAIALAAAGYNPSDVDGYNLLLPLTDFNYATRQGINGAIFTLMAIDSGSYNLNNQEQLRRDLLEYIMGKYIPGGGWAYSGDNPDVDMTAMTLRALAPYYNSSPDIHLAIDMSISTLSVLQEDDGAYSSLGVKNAESTAQVLATMAVLGVDINDIQFVKNGNTVLDGLYKFYDGTTGGFKHSLDGDVNQMATEQTAYALALYNNRDITFYVDDNEGFRDIDSSKYKSEIEQLSKKGIINGKSEAFYEPYSNVTRAEFAKIISEALNLSGGENIFSDVSEADWFCKYVSAAYSNGIINGVSETEFAPYKSITREEAAVMCARAVKTVKDDTDEKYVYLSSFPDYMTLNSWSVNEMAYCIKMNIIDNSLELLKPDENIKRDETAYMIFNLIK